MAENVHQLRPKPGDSEKITINVGYVDLGHIDLMVQEGFFSNRTDFIRTAIRNQLERHTDAVKQTLARKKVELGLRHFSCEDLEAVRATGQSSIFVCWGWRALQTMSPPSLPARRSDRSRCWARCTPVQL